MRRKSSTGVLSEIYMFCFNVINGCVVLPCADSHSIPLNDWRTKRSGWRWTRGIGGKRERGTGGSRAKGSFLHAARYFRINLLAARWNSPKKGGEKNLFQRDMEQVEAERRKNTDPAVCINFNLRRDGQKNVSS